MKGLVDRFLRYVAVESTSNDACEQTPSSQGQWELVRLLERELREMGVTDVEVTEHGYLMATIPSNIEGAQQPPVIGFIAHLDTSPDASGKNISPRITRYEGEDIVLNEERGILLSENDFPELAHYRGEELIVTDGTTLLGADDKAGVAEIMQMTAELLAHPERKHGKIRIAFTPDEEIGQGTKFFEVERFGADWAYTVDGGEIGELQYENFNAAMATVSIEGRSVHPGSALGKMVNASALAMRLATKLPADEVPERTCGYEGFFHLIEMKGDVERAELRYIIRDHDRQSFENRKQLLTRLCGSLQTDFPQAKILLDMRDQYYNMKEKIAPVMHIVELAKQAMEECGVTPRIEPIRGGTDGAQLSFKGLPCPNLFAGGLNFHGRFEFIPVSSMTAAVKVLCALCEKVVGLLP